MFSQVGVPELLIVLVIVLLVFGTKRLPGLGRQLGSGFREFKDAITGDRHAEPDEEPTESPALPAVSSPGDPPAEQAAAEAASERRG